MKRQDVLREIERAIGRRKLIWFGTRGEDAQPLLAIRQLEEVFSLIAPLNMLALEKEVCLEKLSGRRVDLDSYSLDTDFGVEALELRASLLESLRDSSVVVAYRPLAFLTSVYYPRSAHVVYWGLFHERQAPFEHKPWVETELRMLGVQTVPWKYFSDEDRQRVEEELEAFGSLVLRNNRSDGGAGLRLVESKEELSLAWKLHPEGFFATSPVMVPNISLNVNCCVFPDGGVSFHGPSVQLIGIKGLTSRSFGYCGNDFAAAKLVMPRVWCDLEKMVRSVAGWLVGQGYIGAFGVDAMVHQEQLYLTEVNPRFQGSSALSARIDEELGRSDVFLSHISAFTGVDGTSSESLCELVKLQPDISHILVHNTSRNEIRLERTLEPLAGKLRFHLIPTSEITVAADGVALRAVVRQRVTEDGTDIDKSIRKDLLSIAEEHFSEVARKES